ncbi:acid protease [Desarmillaria tabescens]|uniref:Acid protease n=1 Tax=Armillaria tabescens TaxID=1929756 RepID=A0AA39NQ37_ARMTA|nr:acid protease [Desarmillaria tabescens]KAK0469787.1 acid protease [Desarmillaria tabescens]
MMWSAFTTCAWLFVFAQAVGVAARYAARSSPLILPLQSYARRDVNVNGAHAGITTVGMATTQAYFAILKAGATTFRVALDTASADLWLISTQCTTDVCKAVPRYPLQYKSGTFVTVNNNSTAFSVSYSDGTGAEGFVAKETIQLANLTVSNQALGLMTSSNVTFTDDISGIFGLGFPRLSSFSNTVTNSTPFFIRLAQQGVLDYPVFGLSLTRNDTGSLSIGAIDSSVVTNITNVGWHEVVEFAPIGTENNVSSYLQWAIPLDSFAINGSSLAPSPTYPNITNNASLAMFDVGNNGIYGPYQDVSRLFAAISGSRLVDTNLGLWAIPCDTLIPMSFTFGEQTLTLQPTDYLIGPASDNPNLCLSWPGATSPSSDGIDWQMGVPFLRTVYAAFSYGINTKEPPMIGFYPLKNATNSTESVAMISSFLSSASATVATALPNSLLSTPTYTTPSYTFNSSISAPTGGIVATELANTTYSPIFAQYATNISAMPTIAPTDALETYIVTDTSGVVTTITSTASVASVTLGIPPGWTSGVVSLHTPLSRTHFLCFLLPVALLYISDHLFS